ncbi:MAG TPA: SHOCT domain-containing protein [Thermoplasmata archaeon]|nr:SHOCT domain-containing protein [Thermoplasmata archaeon]
MEPHRSRGYFWVVPTVFFAILLGLFVTWIVANVTGFGVLAPFAHPTLFFFPFGFFLFLLFVFFIFRWAWWGAGWGWYGHRRWYRYDGYNPRDIVQERYARGEITRDQYTQMMADLDRSPPSTVRP